MCKTCHIYEWVACHAYLFVVWGKSRWSLQSLTPEWNWRWVWILHKKNAEPKKQKFSQTHLEWHFPKLKAQSSYVSFYWYVVKETYEFWALSFGKRHSKWDWPYSSSSPSNEMTLCHVFACTLSSCPHTTLPAPLSRSPSFIIFPPLFVVVCDCPLFCCKIKNTTGLVWSNIGLLGLVPILRTSSWSYADCFKS